MSRADFEVSEGKAHRRMAVLESIASIAHDIVQAENGISAAESRLSAALRKLVEALKALETCK